MRTTTTLIAAMALFAGLLAGCGGDDSSGDGGSTASTAPAAGLKPCDINGKQQDLGASYVTSIEVQGVACPQAEAVIQAYHACRRANGGAGGTCESPVQGFECTEANRQEVPGVQFLADVDCTKGDAEIRSSYTQNF